MVPLEEICFALGRLCVPMAGRRVVELRDQASISDSIDDLVIEIELCVGLIFKPLRHYVQDLVGVGSDCVLSVWSPILDVLKPILSDPSDIEHGSSKVFDSSRELTLEHFQNVIMVLINDGVLSSQDAASDLTSITWKAIEEMEFCKPHLEAWQKAASENS